MQFDHFCTSCGLVATWQNLGDIDDGNPIGEF